MDEFDRASDFFFKTFNDRLEFAQGNCFQLFEVDFTVGTDFAASTFRHQINFLIVFLFEIDPQTSRQPGRVRPRETLADRAYDETRPGSLLRARAPAKSLRQLMPLRLLMRPLRSS